MFVRMCVWVLGMCFASQAFAQSGEVTGRVLDAETGEPLPGANLVVEALRLGAVSDQQGRFRIVGVPVGEQLLTVSYIGYVSQEQSVTVSAKQAVTLDLLLQVQALEMDALVVTGMLQGQVRALNQQKTAENIKNVVAADLIGRFPDPNTAEAIQRIPGVSVARDQGEGRYVLVRGTESRLTSVMINGDQLPAPEGETRSVALDVVPTDQISSIELHKALTPDMDADAIGGAVNLVTRQALEGNKVFKLTMASGFNNLVSDGNFQGSVTFGERVQGGRLGYLMSASHYQTNRGSDNMEFEWGDEDFGAGDVRVLADQQLRDYVVTRKRTGLSGTIDYQFDNSSSVFMRGIYNRFGDQEHRRRTRLRFDQGDYASASVTSGSEVERELKNRYEQQEIYSFTVGGRQELSGLTVDYSGGYSYADEDEPGRQDITFVMEDVNFSYDTSVPNYPSFEVTNGTDIHDLANYEFDELVLEDNKTTDKNVTAKLQFKFPFQWQDNQGHFRLGGKLRLKDKKRTNRVQILDGYGGALRLSELSGTFEDDSFMGGRYTVGKMPDPKKVSQFYDTNLVNFELDADGSREDTDPANYRAEENVYATFAETRVDLGKLMVLLGARYEFTDLSYVGNEVVFDQEGDYASTREVTGQNDYGDVFPMLHLRYGVDRNTNVRVALTRSMARPNYYDLVPYQVVKREDDELERGNSALKPTLSSNFDLMFERYLQSVGVVSGGFFYKKLTDYIYSYTFDEVSGSFDGFEVVQPVNGGDATLWGIEATWQQQLTSLPGWLSGFGLYANYTYAHSEAEVVGRSDKPTLPGQAKHMANVAVSYEKKGFSGRLALNVHGAYIAGVSDKPSDDLYYAKHSQLDLSLSQEVRPNLRVFVEMINLTDEPLRFYQGSSDHIIQQEFYSWWGHMGVKMDF